MNEKVTTVTNGNSLGETNAGKIWAFIPNHAQFHHTDSMNLYREPLQNQGRLPGPQVPPRTQDRVSGPSGPGGERMLSVSGKKKCSHCKEELGKGDCFHCSTHLLEGGRLAWLHQFILMIKCFAFVVFYDSWRCRGISKQAWWPVPLITFVRKELSRINWVYCWRSFSKTHEHFNFLQLTQFKTINTNWKL